MLARWWARRAETAVRVVFMVCSSLEVSAVGGSQANHKRAGRDAVCLETDGACWSEWGETLYSPVELAGNFGAGNRFLWRSSPSITRVAQSDCIWVNCSPFSKAARAKKSASSSDQS